MKAVDRFGILQPRLGAVKDCALFEGKVPPPGASRAAAPAIQNAPPMQSSGPAIASVSLSFQDMPRRATELNAPARYAEFGVVGVRVQKDGDPEWSKVVEFPLPNIMNDFPDENDVDFAPYQAPLDPRVTVWKVSRTPWKKEFGEGDFTGRNGNAIGAIRLFIKPIPGYAVTPQSVDVRRGDRVEQTVVVTQSSLAGGRAGGQIRPQNAPVFGAKGPTRGMMTTFGARPGSLRRMF